MPRLSRPLCLLALLASPALADMPAPELRGQIVLPSALSLNGVTFGGISDLDYDASTGHFLAISDDRAQHGPARFYELALTAQEDHIALDILATHELTNLDGTSFAEKAIDPEGIAVFGDRILWSSERNAEGAPQIFVAGRDGRAEALATLPAYHIPNADETAGVYNNQGYEGLTLSADGHDIYASTESALRQDGPKATLEEGSPARILVLDADSLTPKAEYLYVTETIALEPTEEPFWKDNGLSALAVLDDGRLITVERSFAKGAGNAIRFFITDLSGADNILGQAQITPADIQAVQKTPWFSIYEGDFGLDIDNIESFAFGPDIDGARSFVIASDDNFNPAGQFSQFVVFTLPAVQ